MERLPPSQQKYASTPKAYENLGKILNYPPIKIEYIMKGSGMRAYDALINTIEIVSKGKKIREKADIPYFGRLFVREPRGWGSASVQQLEKKVSKAENTIKEVVNEKFGFRFKEKDAVAIAQALLKKFGEDSPEYKRLSEQIEIYNQLEDSYNEIKSINRDINDIQRKEDLSEQEISLIEDKKALIRDIAKNALLLQRQPVKENKKPQTETNKDNTNKNEIEDNNIPKPNQLPKIEPYNNQ